MTELLPCPFCGGEAHVNDDPTGNGGKPHMSGNVGLGRLWSVECDECGADAGFWQDESVAIAAWNTRVDYHGYEKAAIEAWESIKAWNSRAERTCRIEWRYGNQYCTCCGEMVGTCDSTSELYIDGNMVELWNYCPNCGAKVVGE